MNVLASITNFFRQVGGSTSSDKTGSQKKHSYRLYGFNMWECEHCNRTLQCGKEVILNQTVENAACPDGVLGIGFLERKSNSVNCAAEEGLD